MYLYSIYFPGKELIDIFISPNKNKDGEEDESDFKEPLELEGKLRWQIIRLMPTNSKSSRGGGGGGRERKTDSADDSNQLDECSEEVEELVRKEVDVSYWLHMRS